jgi:hypothetical protein
MPGYVPSRYCAAEEIAVKAAVDDRGGPIMRIKILATGLPCGVPWPLGSPVCPLEPVQAAYVTFAGTSRVAALTITLLHSGTVAATLTEFLVPPAWWSIDTAR